MGKCPFCAEEIHDEAVKCKHCGEWLDHSANSGSLLQNTKSMLNKAQNFYKKKKRERRRNKYKHLKAPTSTEPVKIQNFEFYDEYLKKEDEKISYKEIISIYFFAKRNSSHGIINDDELEFKLYFKNNFRNFPLDNAHAKKIRIKLSSFVGLGSSSKEKDKLKLVIGYLQRKTLENRFHIYAKHLIENGYFHYPDAYKIYNDGNIKKNDKFKVNIIDSNNEDLLQYGTSLNASRIKTSNPYLLIVGHPNKNDSWFGDSTHINTYYDKDLIDKMFEILLRQGKFLV